MARERSKKGKKRQLLSSSDKLEANGAPPAKWPDLPQQLIHVLSMEPTLLGNIYWKGVTKLWRATNGKCKSINSTTPPPPPWLELSNNPLEAKSVSADSGSSFHASLRRIKNIYTRSWLVFDQYLSGDVSLPFDYKSRSYKEKRFELVWKGMDRPLYYCNRPWPNDQGTYGWRRLDCNIVDPHCYDPSEPKHFLRITNGIGFQGKFFVLSLQGTLAVVDEEVNLQLRITRLGKKRAVPSVSSSCFRECMVESDGEIWLIFLVCKESMVVVDDVEVYWLNTDDLTWITKKSIGDMTLFVGSNCVMSVLASKVGCRRNCVYFTINCSPDSWWVYDMEKGIISDGSNSFKKFLV